MANTNGLKEVVEPFMVKEVLKKYEATKLPIKVILEMHPDLLAYTVDTVIIGEATTSGFNGSKRGNYHAGGIKKLFEAFCKFSILKSHEDEILSIFSEETHCSFKKIRYLFIVPKGSKFIDGLGYRQRLLSMNIMELELVKLNPETDRILKDNLKNCQDENKSK
jgi:hypothetical protein